MRELRNRNINDLVRYLKRHKQGHFRGKHPCDCPVAQMYQEKLGAAEVSVGTEDVAIKRRTYRTYALSEDFRAFVCTFDATYGSRWVLGEDALKVAELVRDELRREYLESLHAA